MSRVSPVDGPRPYHDPVPHPSDGLASARPGRLHILILFLLLVFGVGTPPLQAATEPEIRIGLVRGTRQLLIEGALGGKYRAWKFRASGRRFVEEGSGRQYARLQLNPARDKPVRVSGKAYRGRLELLAGDKGIVVVNIVLLEEYLRGVVPREIGTGVPREAQRAQAIIARSYTLTQLGRHRRDGFDLCASTHCQVYEGISAEHPRSDAAVRSTRGVIVVTSKGQPFAPFYSAGCGGMTATPAEAWAGGAASDHLQSVTCPICQKNPHPWTLELPTREFLAALARSGYRLKHLERIDVLQVSGSGRIGALALSGAGETLILSGYALRAAIGPDRVKSTLFAIRLGPAARALRKTDVLSRLISRVRGRPRHGTMVILEGSGWGHGVGLCQRGAIGLASRGSGHRSILRRYLPGVDFKRLY